MIFVIMGADQEIDALARTLADDRKQLFVDMVGRIASADAGIGEDVHLAGIGREPQQDRSAELHLEHIQIDRRQHILRLVC